MPSSSDFGTSAILASKPPAHFWLCFTHIFVESLVFSFVFFDSSLQFATVRALKFATTGEVGLGCLLAAGAIDYGCENFRNLSKNIVNVFKLFFVLFVVYKLQKTIAEKLSSISTRFAETVGVARRTLVPK